MQVTSENLPFNRWPIKRRWTLDKTQNKDEVESKPEENIDIDNKADDDGKVAIDLREQIANLVVDSPKHENKKVVVETADKRHRHLTFDQIQDMEVENSIDQNVRTRNVKTPENEFVVVVDVEKEDEVTKIQDDKKVQENMQCENQSDKESSSKDNKEEGLESKEDEEIKDKKEHSKDTCSKKETAAEENKEEKPDKNSQSSSSSASEEEKKPRRTSLFLPLSRLASAR